MTNTIQLDHRQRTRTLIALMLPQFMIVTNLAIINVALPAIRETFNAPADLMAWVVTMYSLPYVAFMPLYGRLGDELGIRRMLLLGAGFFMAGTLINALSHSLPLLLVGRFIQGIGASGTAPLAMAMIARIYPEETRGRALGQWNSIGPLASVVASFAAGLIIDRLDWHTTFYIALAAGVIATVLVFKDVPRAPQQNSNSLRSFDWWGVGLLTLTLAGLLFYLNSRTVTGRAALTDWRLLLGTVIVMVAFIWREQHTEHPFVELSTLADPNFFKASLTSGLRMVIMASFSFLGPLFLTDVWHLNATTLGIVTMVRSIALFPTMYFGGRVADQWGSRKPVILGVSVGVVGILLVMLPSTEQSLAWIILGLSLNGLGFGLALPALHRAALNSEVGLQRGGAASGLYSMIRFWGQMLGTAICGVLLQFLFDQGVSIENSYRISFGLTAAVALLAVGVISTLKEQTFT